jgi:hypothetical protein
MWEDTEINELRETLTHTKVKQKHYQKRDRWIKDDNKNIKIGVEQTYGKPQKKVK